MLSSFHAERFFVSLLWYLIVNLQPDIVDKENRVQSVPTQELLREYDYVIIGGGSAGAVLASRLSEDMSRTVLLLEAGSDEVVVSDVPVTYTLIQRSFMNWPYMTEPSSSYCLAMENHQCRLPQGKVLCEKHLVEVFVSSVSELANFHTLLPKLSSLPLYSLHLVLDSFVS